MKTPWLTYGAIEWLNNHLRSDMKVFEFGSGGSTIYFRSRVRSVVTVEHDSNWFDKVNAVLEKNENPDSKIILVPPQKMDKMPNDYKYSSHTFPQYSGYSFKKYVETINNYPDSWFDLILVDGRARVACVMDAVKKVQKGGYLILDNSDRNHYKAVYDFMKQYPIKEYFGFGPLLNELWKTTIWQVVRE